MADVIAHATWLWRQLGYDVIREEDVDDIPRYPLNWSNTRFVVAKSADRDPAEPDLLPYEPYCSMTVIEMLNALPGGNPRGGTEDQAVFVAASKQLERWSHALHPAFRGIVTDDQWFAVRQAIFKQAVTDCQHATRLRLRQKALEDGGENADDAHQEMWATFEDQMQGAPAPEPKRPTRPARARIGCF